MQAVTRRQPLTARVWGGLYRSWWWAPGARNKDKAKRRAARRKRAAARQAYSRELDADYPDNP